MDRLDAALRRAGPPGVRAIWWAVAVTLVLALAATGGTVAEDALNGPLLTRILLFGSLVGAILSCGAFTWEALKRTPRSSVRDHPRRAVALAVALIGFFGSVGSGVAAAGYEAFVDPSPPSIDAGGGVIGSTGGGGSFSSPLDLRWTVPDRLHAQDPEPTKEELATERYPVDLDVVDEHDGSCRRPYSWTTTGDGHEVHPHMRRVEGCHFQAVFSHQGPYTVTVAKAAERSPPTRILVRDWLIVSLGDSVASGEGNPLPGGKWRDRTKCHRSDVAGPRLAALQLEWSDDKSSVTFVHLACTGARIRAPAGEQVGPGKVLLGSDTPLTQLGEAAEILPPKRKVDAVVLSFGANDIRFANVLTFCLAHRRCFDHSYEAASTLDLVVRQRIAALRQSYEALAAAALRLAPSQRVYIAEYFDPTTGRNDRPCRIGPFFGRDTSRWAHDRLVDLNAEIAQAATNYGWTDVSGIAARFLGHGYCASKGARWVRKIGARPLTTAPFHPNADGQRIYGQVLFKALHHGLYGSSAGSG